MTDLEIYQKAVEQYASDDIDVLSHSIDRVDGGAWIKALVFVAFDTCNECGEAATHFIELGATRTYVCGECFTEVLQPMARGKDPILIRRANHD